VSGSAISYAVVQRSQRVLDTVTDLMGGTAQRHGAAGADTRGRGVVGAGRVRDSPNINWWGGFRSEGCCSGKTGIVICRSGNKADVRNDGTFLDAIHGEGARAEA